MDFGFSYGVCVFELWIRTPKRGYVLSRESVFQLRHRSHVRIPPKPRTARFRLNAPFAATYPLERNTRFARDCRPFFNKILREGRFARDCRPFFNNIPKRQRFARDRRRFSKPTRPIGLSQSMVLSQNTRGTFKGFHWTLGFLTACVFSNLGYTDSRDKLRIVWGVRIPITTPLARPYSTETAHGAFSAQRAGRGDVPLRKKYAFCARLSTVFQHNSP